MASSNGSRTSALARAWAITLAAFRSHTEAPDARDPSRHGRTDEGRARVAYTSEADLPEISDDEFATVRGELRPYTAVGLKAGPRFEPPDPGFTSEVGRIIFEHGRRNASLKRAGLMPIVCPVGDDSEVCGICILDADLADADRIMANDPGVKAGVFVYDLHPTRSFPGSSLP